MTPEDEKLIERVQWWIGGGIRDEIADAIKRLSKSIDLKDAAMRQLEADNKRLSAEVELLKNGQTSLMKENKIIDAERVALRAQIAVDGCITHQLSSRMCEKGTNGCEVRHAKITQNFRLICATYENGQTILIDPKESPVKYRKFAMEFCAHPAADAKDADLLAASRAVHEYIISHPVRGFDIPDALYTQWVAAMKGGS